MKVAALPEVSLPNVSWPSVSWPSVSWPSVSWKEGQESAVRMWKQARESSEDFLYKLNRQVRRHPWKALAIGVGAGIVLGTVISRAARN